MLLKHTHSLKKRCFMPTTNKKYRAIANPAAAEK
jgi:hypothetical protein